MSIHHFIRRLDQESITLYNRLRSIEEDLFYVEKIIATYYPNLPLVANLRCGAWYHPQFDEFVHFKSSDGHRGQWQLSLKRLNLHIISLLVESGACILVDSTKKSRTLPDSYSRTIPIWCSVINRVACHLCGRPIYDSYVEKSTKDCNNINHSSSADTQLETWDCTLYCPTTTVPPQEYDQIHAILQERVESLLHSGFDLSVLKSMKKPIRPTFVSPADDNVDTEEEVLGNGFYTIICLSASQPVDVEKREHFTYIQGAGDDEEMWSLGLTAQMFWDHKREILDAPTSIDCDEVVKQIVAQCGSGEGSFSTPSIITNLSVHDQALMKSQSSTFQVGTTPLYLGNKFASVSPWCFDSFDAVINCCTAEEVPNQTVSKAYMQLNIPLGKKHKRELEEQLSGVLKFSRHHLAKKHSILITCDSGFDRGTTVAVAILAAFFDDNGQSINWVDHKGDLSNSSIEIPDLVKADFARCLQLISLYEPRACPSRHNMKKLNTFFLSADVPEDIWIDQI